VAVLGARDAARGRFAGSEQTARSGSTVGTPLRADPEDDPAGALEPMTDHEQPPASAGTAYPEASMTKIL
jgi:hypothetical protein